MVVEKRELYIFFFFQAEDGIRDYKVTGVQTCALPISSTPLPAGLDGDAADAEQLYRLLETEVVPLFYDRDAESVPRGWVEKMKHAVRAAGARFTAQRMVREYLAEYYRSEERRCRERV